MLRNKLYYQVKPLLPRPFRLAIRRWFATGQRRRVENVWPILPGSETPPPNWPGWPGGKRFAFVITHDVEGAVGLARCRQLMELEKGLGFRSSFNFVPEGEYIVSPELRAELTRNGFEVGIHDLRHDGKLYQSRHGFCEKAARINRHLQDWGAAGFRSGFMLHNLDWLHQLNVEYDSSTFDTDPFEPQPDGVGTIFPFWVPRGREFNHRGTENILTTDHADYTDGEWDLNHRDTEGTEKGGQDSLNVQRSTLNAESSRHPEQKPLELDRGAQLLNGKREGEWQTNKTGTFTTEYTERGKDFNHRDTEGTERILTAEGNGDGGRRMGDGYVELPYTLPQDSTLFLLFRERTPDIWLAKLDWIAKHGGMALLITHPDYMSFDNGARDDNSYPASLYEQLLEWANRRHPGQYWNASPKEVADYFCKTLHTNNSTSGNGAPHPDRRGPGLRKATAAPSLSK